MIKTFLLLIIVGLQVVGIILMFKLNPNSKGEIGEIFAKQKGSSESKDDNAKLKDDNATLKDDHATINVENPVINDSDRNINETNEKKVDDSNLGPNTTPGSDTTHLTTENETANLNPETENPPDTKPNSHTHLDDVTEPKPNVYSNLTKEFKYETDKLKSAFN
jgi:hypothetical protein